MDTKDLLNDSSIHHGRNLVCLMNRKGFKVEDLEKTLQLSQKQVEDGWTACNTYINMASASTRWT